jgi:hypothetical protein
MKTVFTSNKELCHVFAQQVQDTGKTGNLFFNGNVLYSYGWHYPVVVLVSDSIAIFNGQGYSNTTNRHTSLARQALLHYKRHEIESTDIIKQLIRFTQSEKTTDDIKALLVTVKWDIASTIKNLQDRLASKDAAKRRITTLDKWKGEASSKVNDCLKLLEILEIKPSAEIKKEIKKLEKNVGDLFTAAQTRAQREAKKREKAKAEYLKEVLKLKDKAIAAWREGGSWLGADMPSVQTILDKLELPPLLRLHDNEIVTSMGARFPVKDAIEVYPVLTKLKDSGKPITLKDNDRLRLGYYAIESIDKEGNVKAGCHTVPWTEIALIAQQLGL